MSLQHAYEQTMWHWRTLTIVRNVSTHDLGALYESVDQAVRRMARLEPADILKVA